MWTVSYPELSVQSAMRRMSIITVSMQRDAISALKELSSQIAREVLITDNEVDRFNLYIIRQLKNAIQNPRIIKEIGIEEYKRKTKKKVIKPVIPTLDEVKEFRKKILEEPTPITSEE